ncbi:hypothetical protein LJB42_003231 [Komagataella kurtzmanii]|nr:hypothetical protein LJB42_003231 [Komagataella kurtzmanii]
MDSFDRLSSYLVRLPFNSDFKFSNQVRKDIRKTLYYIITEEGQYLEHCFPPPKELPALQWNERKNCYEPSDSVSDSFEWVAEDSTLTHSDHPGMPCAKKFKRGEACYRCLTCSTVDTCALCQACFESSSHEGHKYFINITQRENVGVCDCGDSEAWASPIGCKHFTKDPSKIPDDLPEDYLQRLHCYFSIILDYTIDVLATSTLSIGSNQQNLSSVIDYSKKSNLSEQVYHAEDTTSSHYMLVLYNDQLKQYRDAVQCIRAMNGNSLEFAEMVANQIQNYGKAYVLGGDEAMIESKKTILDNYGMRYVIRSYRDVFREEMCDEIVKWMDNLTTTPLFRMFQSVRDVFCEVFLQKWSPGLADMSIGTFNDDHLLEHGLLGESYKILNFPDNLVNVPQRFYISYMNSKHEPKVWDISRGLTQQVGYDLTSHAKNFFRGSRLQYLWYFDIRLWKSLRTTIHDIYVSALLANQKYRVLINCQYVDIYPQIAQMFLTLDREPENSLMVCLSTQLFASSANTDASLERGDLKRMLLVVYSFLTRVEGDPDVTEVNFDAMKNKKWGQIMFDMSHLISRSTKHEFLFDHDLWGDIIDLVGLFQGCSTMKRAAEEHVQYESNNYAIYFYAISLISYFCEAFAKCVTRLTEEEYQKLTRNEIKSLINTLYQYCFYNKTEKVIADQVSVFKRVRMQNCNPPDFIVTNYDISTEVVSLLHPLHSFVSWVIEMNKTLETPQDLIHLFELDAEVNRVGAEDAHRLQRIFEFPLRTLVILSQIKIGYWVRNGFTIRTQMHIYRDSGIRECGFMRDLFMVQVFFSIEDPSTALVSFLDKWGLTNWCNGITEDESVYDKVTIPYIVEESLLSLINLLTEDTHLDVTSEDGGLEKTIKREIIHSLAFKPLTFSQILSEVPEHISCEKKFDYYLKEVADFSPPKGYHDNGLYKVKDKLYNAIDPYYIHYTSNKREEALQILLKRKKDKTGESVDKQYFSPKKVKYTNNSPFSRLPLFTQTDIFAKFIYSTLKYVIESKLTFSATIFDLLLHLIHVCVMISGTSILKHFLDDHTNIFQLLYSSSKNQTFSRFHAKLKAIFVFLHDSPGFSETEASMLREKITDFNYASIVSGNLEPGNDECEVERKRKIGKEKSAKILAKFKRQQEKFLRNNNFEDVSDKSQVTGCDPPSPKNFEEQCILCRIPASEKNVFGMICHVSDSSEFRDIPFDDHYWFIKAFSDNECLDVKVAKSCLDDPKYNEKWKSFNNRVKKPYSIGPGLPTTFRSYAHSKPVVSSCGHGMHFSCYLEYMESIKSRQTQITRTVPEDSTKNEFLCPLCKSLNNIFVPVSLHQNNQSLANYLNPGDSFSSLTLSSIDRIVQQYTHQHAFVVSQEFMARFQQSLGSQSIKKRTSSFQISYQECLSTSLQSLTESGSLPVSEERALDVLVNTIESAEIGLRGSSVIPECPTILTQKISNQLLTILKVWNHYRDSIIMENINNQLQGAVPKELTFGEAQIAIIRYFNAEDVDPAFGSCDFFKYVVAVYPSESLGLSYSAIVRMFYSKHIIQAFYNLCAHLVSNNFYNNEECSFLDIPCLSDDLMNEEGIECTKPLVNHLLLQHYKSEFPYKDTDKFYQVFYSMIVRLMTPFLRRCVLLASMRNTDWSGIDFDELDDIPLELDKLSHMLHLPPLHEMLLEIFDTRTAMLNELSYRLMAKQFDIQRLSLQYPGYIELINLPERLDMFFTYYYYRMENRPKDPAVCLFCGTILDMQQSAIGMKMGQCNIHCNYDCLNEVGIFFVPKCSAILVLYNGNGSFYESPYLNCHGELDEEVKNNRPLYLNEKRYKRLTNIWLQHDIPNYTARKLEGTVDIGGWDTM